VPRAEVSGATIHYEVEGEGEPLLLVPCLAADNACWALQLPAYAERFRCIAVDLPGSGESPVAEGRSSTEGHADELAELLDALGVERAHVAGVSLGAAVATHLAARHPERVRTLSLHSAWPATDPFLRACMESWRALAGALPTVADLVVQGIFPWVFTPEMYARRPEVLEQFAEVVHGRPAQSLEGFMAQSQAVIDHDATAVLDDIMAPTLVTFGGRDLLTSTRFAGPLLDGIADARLLVFDHLSHAGLNEDADTFTAATLEFLRGTSR
jgi:3-oxoadipate enol-lactonase